MQSLIKASAHFIKQQRPFRRSVLRLWTGLVLSLFACAAFAQAQMRPMSDVTVGQRESRSAAPAASSSSTQKSAAPREASTREASTRREGTQRSSNVTRETVAPVERTRARRVSNSPAATATTAATAATVETVMDDEPPPMPPAKAKAAGEAEDENEAGDAAEAESAVGASGAARLNTLRTQIENATDEKERARLRRMLVDYLVSLDQRHKAVAELREMMREERFDPVGFYNIGNALVRLGDADTAIDAYRKAVDQRHGNYSRALNNLGVVLLRQGRWDEAQDALVSALRQENYSYAEASYNLGRLYAARGEADLAIAEWRRTLSLQPDHADAALALAHALAEDGSPQRALEVLDQFTARGGPTKVFNPARQEVMKEAARLRAESLSVKAASADTQAQAAPGGNIVARPLQVDAETYELLRRARTAREGGRFEEAVGFYRRALAAHSNFFPPANLEMSYALMNLKRTDEAIETLNALVAKDGAHYPVAYYHLARLYESQGNLSLARQNYDHALAAYGETNPQLMLDVSRMREQSGDIRGAITMLESYLRMSERQGRTPDWAKSQLERLQGKLAASSAPVPATRQ